MKFLYCIILTCLLTACTAAPKAATPTPTPFLAAGEFSIPMDDGTLISAEIHGKGQPLVILAYGAGMESWEPLTSEIVAQGHTVLNFDYRGMGKSGGKVGNLIGDMANILRYLREHGYPKIICVGRSMGGGACLLAAHEPGMAGFVLVNSITPQDFYPSLNLRYDDLTYRKLMFVSKDEGLLESNQALFDAAAQPKQLMVYPSSSHNLLHTEYSDEIRAKILTFINTFDTPQPAPTATHAYTLKPQAQPYEREKPLPYYLYLPKNYTPDRAWPLFVSLHGAGGNAYDCIYNWQKYADDEGFVLMCPSLQDPTGGWENDEKKVTLYEAINAVRQECHVLDGIFLTGFSRGAHLAQRFAWAYPNAVGAVAVLSAVTYDTPETLPKNIPFLTVIGDYDHPDGIEQVKTFTKQLTQAGASAEFQILPNTGHTMTDAAAQLTLEFFRKTFKKAIQP